MRHEYHRPEVPARGNRTKGRVEHPLGFRCGGHSHRNQIFASELPSTVDLDEMKRLFSQHGYAVARGLFSTIEVEAIKMAFDKIAKGGAIPGQFEKVPAGESGGDPSKELPRVNHPHRFDPVSRKNLIHPGLLTCLRELMQDDVLAAQSMFYYKPPGSRGQAIHQDNFYLMVEPATCVAAWTAIDHADPENGGMYLVADTANEEIACPQMANQKESFTTHFVPTPKVKKALPCVMKGGDTLFLRQFDSWPRSQPFQGPLPALFHLPLRAEAHPQHQQVLHPAPHARGRGGVHRREPIRRRIRPGLDQRGFLRRRDSLSFGPRLGKGDTARAFPAGNQATIGAAGPR